ncbi:GyrI-like domain-containing protein [Caldalkalibacillus salinus]|uniref:GyrI-like domain-containing protein n=1 Tax=Caldalkalibacillus salinus TaxID=2803787 RepID=UPI0019239699|nr:GyrI-like domain-containing protein [Caldalkalibacillus salinus]
MKGYEFEVVTQPAYRAIGLKWDGPWSDISQLKAMIQEVSQRVGELEHAVNPQIQLGLSYHLRPDGFVHYSAYEVTDEQDVPEGMVEIAVPEMTYLMTQHQKGQDIGQTYNEVWNWMTKSEYDPYREPSVQYFDDYLPIKHERYPADRDLEDPHFDILIPIIKQR